MTARSAVFASLFLLSALPAAAAGDNVILIDVSKVDLPSRLPGLCNVNGTITGVRQGTAFHPGQPIALKVPCSAGNSILTPANAILGETNDARFIAADVLLKSREGIARVDDSGVLIWQRSDGNNSVVRHSDGENRVMEVATGYRVLDGVAVPVAPERANP